MKENCVFCHPQRECNVLFDRMIWKAVLDEYPVSKGHTLIIPKEHVKTYFDLSDSQKESLHYAIEEVKRILDERFHPQGYNIGINCGEVAGQTIPHCHIHVIPRYEGDVENPRGGVRGCIPSRMDY
jgi:diadenosine tetraphosphate (Ap4A) HIT family hydrolase